MADEQPKGSNGNGAVTKYRVDRLEHRIKGIEQGVTLLSKFGERNNSQILVHDEQFKELRGDIQEMREGVVKVPVLEERVATLLDGFRDAKRALWAAAGSFLVLAATIVWQASQ